MKRAPALPRVVKGKRPQFFTDPSNDLAISMIVTLAQELCVMRTRLDAIESLSAKKGGPTAAEIDGFIADEETLKRQEQWRQDLMARLFYVLKQQAAEVAGNDTEQRFNDVIADIAKN